MAEPERTIETLEFVGGDAALDFANTGSERVDGHVQTERLHTYADLVVFAERVGLLDDEQAAGLLTQAAERPEEAAHVLARAIELRECIFRIFTAIADGRRPADDDVETLNGFLAEGLSYRRLVRDSRCCAWTWSTGENPLAQMLWPIASGAAELMVHGELDRVKECGNEGCDWLFLDLSRNRSRRWCDMKECGNRAKARRHYARHRASD